MAKRSKRPICFLLRGAGGSALFKLNNLPFRVSMINGDQISYKSAKFDWKNNNLYDCEKIALDIPKEMPREPISSLLDLLTYDSRCTLFLMPPWPQYPESGVPSDTISPFLIVEG